MSKSKSNMVFSEKNMTKIFFAVFVGIIVILLAVIFIMLGTKNGGDTDDSGSGDIPAGSSGAEIPSPPIGTSPVNNDTNIPELKIVSIDEQTDDVVISTSYCTLKYPSAYSELIGTEVYFGDGTGCIMFSAMIGGGSHTVYSLLFNNEGGIQVGLLKLDGVDEPIRVSVVFYDPTEDITGDDLTGFYAAQETFNDIVNSLEENEGFTSLD